MKKSYQEPSVLITQMQPQLIILEGSPVVYGPGLPGGVGGD